MLLTGQRVEGPCLKNVGEVWEGRDAGSNSVSCPGNRFFRDDGHSLISLFLVLLSNLLHFLPFVFFKE